MSASLEHAGEGAVSFLANPRYRKHLRVTRATAVILQEKYAGEAPGAVLVVANPCAAFARAVASLPGAQAPARQGIHPGAVTGEHCRIDASAWVGPRCVLEDGVIVGAGTRLARRPEDAKAPRRVERSALGAGPSDQPPGGPAQNRPR